MKYIETPYDFAIEKEFANHKIKYCNLTEFSQGSPEIGSLMIDEKIIPSHLFSGPAIENNNNLYLPVFVKSFIDRGFKICCINMNTLDIKFIGKKKNFINIDKVEKDTIYYFEDQNRTKVLTLSIK